MPYSGPFQAGDRVQLTDAKRRHFTIILEPGGSYHTHRGQIPHDEIIGADEGTVVQSTMGSDFLCFRHLMVDHVLSMPRGAAARPVSRFSATVSSGKISRPCGT